MNKRILITSTDLMMVQFLVPHVQYLSQNGFAVEIACSDVGGCMEEMREKLEGYAKAIHTVRLVRSPTSSANFKGYGDMKKVIENGRYDIIWTNEPVMGVVTRLAARKARKRGTKVVYMCHGFHFFKGSGKASWLLYYPMERVMSRFTDTIVTINREDEARAKTFHAKQVVYIHGIGVNTERLRSAENRTDIRAELGLQDDDFLVLSVGELNKNKNHRVVIEALHRLQDPQIHYAICGKGALLDKLNVLARSLGLEKNVHFLGYRTDVVDVCSQVDVFAFPSHREGLGLAALEAMYCGLPVVASRIRGPMDFMESGKSGMLTTPDDAEGFAQAISDLKQNKALRRGCSEYNKKAVIPYCLEQVKGEVLELFEGFLK